MVGPGPEAAPQHAEWAPGGWAPVHLAALSLSTGGALPHKQGPPQAPPSGGRHPTCDAHPHPLFRTIPCFYLQLHIPPSTDWAALCQRARWRYHFIMEPFSFASSDSLDYPVSIRMWVYPSLSWPRCSSSSPRWAGHVLRLELRARSGMSTLIPCPHPASTLKALSRRSHFPPSSSSQTSAMLGPTKGISPLDMPPRLPPPLRPAVPGM